MANSFGQIFVVGGGLQYPFNKDTVAGLVGWHDASDSSTLTLSGSDVTAWADKSGNSNNITNTSATKPVLTSSVLNGLPGVFFGGSAYMYQTGITARSSSYGSVYLVLKPTNWGTGGYQTIFKQATAGEAVRTFEINKNNGDTNIYTYSYNTAQANSGTMTNNNPFVVGVRFNGASGTCKVNSTSTAITTGTLGATDTAFVILGSSSGGQIWTGYLMELLIFNASISDANDTYVRNYLNEKWGVY